MGKKQDWLIASLRKQPLLVVLRPNKNELEDFSTQSDLFKIINKLSKYKIKHIEISWLDDPRWLKLVRILLQDFPNISIGAASILDLKAIDKIEELGLGYGISPIFDETLQKHAQVRRKILIPGVLTPTEINKAKNHGCNIVKLFPASHTGIKYLSQIRNPLNPLPFIIAAGGLRARDINPWLKAGHNAIAIGRELICKGEVDPELLIWLDQIRKN